MSKCYNECMFKRLFIIAFLLVLVSGIIGIWLVYRGYSARQAERQARLVQQVEETTATVIEGWSVVEIAAYYEKLGLFSKDDFIKAIHTFQKRQRRYGMINEMES